MLLDCRQQFRKTLTKVDWMDDKTRQQALEKADAMASHIAYPSEMLDNDKLTDFYAGVSMLSFFLATYHPVRETIKIRKTDSRLQT